eukprot:6724132-Prymnesium_polylepis.1
MLRVDGVHLLLYHGRVEGRRRKEEREALERLPERVRVDGKVVVGVRVRSEGVGRAAVLREECLELVRPVVDARRQEEHHVLVEVRQPRQILGVVPRPDAHVDSGGGDDARRVGHEQHLHPIPQRERAVRTVVVLRLLNLVRHVAHRTSLIVRHDDRPGDIVSP